MRADHTQNRAPHSHPPLVIARVKAHYQHPETRQWTITAELRGGRVVTGIQPTFATSGVYSGSRPELPAIGSWGLVGYAESDLGMDAYFLGCFDGHAYGLDRDSPHESVSMHRSGLGKAVAPDGTMTTHFPGGDELIVGSGAGFDFKARDDKGKTYKPSLPARALRVVLEASRGGLLLGARLIGGVEVIVDAAKRKMHWKVSEKDTLTLQPGKLRAQTGAMVVGQSEEMAAALARWPETKATLEALSKEVQQLKHAIVQERAANIKQDTQIQIISSIPPILASKAAVMAVPKIPLPFITPQGKDGALVASTGGVQVVEAGTKTLQAE